MEALIVGKAPLLMFSLPYLLARSGFAVDVVSTSSLLGASRFVRDVCVTETPDEMLAESVARITQRDMPYDWVIACDDETLRSMSEISWPAGREPRHLTLRTAGRSHIYSKIGLSQTLRQSDLKTPDFRVVGDCGEALSAAHDLGYPVYLKLDSGNGGAGVFLCQDDEDIYQLANKFVAGPMIIQKRIEGLELDLSAIYFDGKLVHFSYSSIERALPRNGPSVLRSYLPLAMVGDDVVCELRALGEALRADGFSTITCIDATDGTGRYYIEADMRPNLWTDISRCYGEDAAVRIRDWFARGAVLGKHTCAAAAQSGPIRIAHFMRVELWELLLNRYQVWKFIPWEDWPVVLSLLWARVVMPGTRALVPGRVRGMVRRGMRALRIAFP